MTNKEQKYYQYVIIVTFIGLILLNKIMESLIVLVIGHLIDIKYQLIKMQQNTTKEKDFIKELKDQRKELLDYIEKH